VIVALVVIVGMTVAPWPWVEAVASAIAAGMVATWALTPIVRQSAYLSGWWAARHAMWSSMVEAEERGLAPGDWAIAERERDLNTPLF
jgi:hypothetical protein